MAGVGEAVIEIAALLDQHLGHTVAHQHPAQRQVARSHALGEGDEVGFGVDVRVLAAEPVPQATEAADDFIGDQQQAVLVADALNLGPIAGRRNDDPARALHRLADEGGHLVGAHFENLGLQPTCGAQAEVVRALARLAVLQLVGLVDVGDARQWQVALFVHAAHAAQRGAAQRAAVIGVVAADDRLALRLAHQIPITAHQADDGVVAFGAGVGEEHMVETGRRHLRQQRRKLGCRGRGGLEKGVVERQGLHLVGGGVHQILPPVAEVDAPQAGHTVDDFVALRVPDAHALAAHDDAAARGVQALGVGEGMQVMRGVLGAQRGGVELGQIIGFHGSLRFRTMFC